MGLSQPWLTFQSAPINFFAEGNVAKILNLWVARIQDNSIMIPNCDLDSAKT